MCAKLIVVFGRAPLRNALAHLRCHLGSSGAFQKIIWMGLGRGKHTLVRVDRMGSGGGVGWGGGEGIVVFRDPANDESL